MFFSKHRKIKVSFLIALALHLLALMLVPYPKSTTTQPLLAVDIQHTASPISSDVYEVSGLEPLSNAGSSLGTPISLASVLNEGFGIGNQTFFSDDKGLKRRTISSQSHTSTDSDYLQAWQTQIEHFGNEHYPREALIRNIKGSLRLMVGIHKDGSIREIVLRQSSGHKILDDAAIRIVQGSAPFEPLPKEIAEQVDILEIVRTWQFKGSLST